MPYLGAATVWLRAAAGQNLAVAAFATAYAAFLLAQSTLRAHWAARYRRVTHTESRDTHVS